MPFTFQIQVSRAFPRNRRYRCFSGAPFISCGINDPNPAIVRLQSVCKVSLWLSAIALLSLQSCEEGISPVSGSSGGRVYGISGVIHFSHWPPADSVLDIRLAALQNYPVPSIPAEVLNGRARYSDQLPYGVDSLPYTLTLPPLPAGNIPFVGVAQRYGPNIQQDWRVVGIYYAGGDTTHPGSVVVPPDSIVPGINITVDFSHLPPQP